MLFINKYSHLDFLTHELEQLLPDGSLASRLRRAIGNELHYRLVDWPDENETEYSSLFPVDALFAWVMKGNGLDPEWFESEDGSYLGQSTLTRQPVIGNAHALDEVTVVHVERDHIETVVQRNPVLLQEFGRVIEDRRAHARRLLSAD